jgi:hypothetical protein
MITVLKLNESSCNPNLLKQNNTNTSTTKGTKDKNDSFNNILENQMASQNTNYGYWITSAK